MTTRALVSRGARALGWVAACASVAALAFACAETRRSLGEECLKNDDCLSGQCTARRCNEPASALDASGLPPTPVDAGTTPADASQDVRVDVGADAPSDARGG